MIVPVEARANMFHSRTVADELFFQAELFGHAVCPEDPEYVASEVTGKHPP